MDFLKLLLNSFDPNKNGVANTFDSNKNGLRNEFDPNKNWLVTELLTGSNIASITKSINNNNTFK